MKYHKDSELSITTKIWNKEIKGLVDYDNTNYNRSKAIINFPGILSRIDKKVIFTKNKDEQTPFKLLSVDKNEEYGFYTIDCGNWSKDISTLVEEGGAFILFKGEFFKNSRTPKETYYKLAQGDIIKIGKYYMKLLDMEIFDDTDSDDDGNNSKKTMIRNSSYNSFIVNGQEIIRGAFTPDKNTNQRVNYDLSSNNLIGQNDSSVSSSNNFFGNKTGNLSFQQKLSFLSSSKKNKNNINNSNINKSVKPGFYLPRINSFGELFMIKSKQNLNIKNRENNQENINIINPSLKIKKNKVCRICYGDDTSSDNPLINPCICKGSMKYIHYKCLKNWLNSKIESEMEQNSDNETIIYNTKDLSCELCKAKFPDYVKIKNKLYNISFYKPKFQEFIVFESMKADKNKNKYIYIISLDNRRCINIGRSSECELSIPELSISRFHAIIHKNKGELFIEDNKSKFGTLILVQNDNIKMNDFLALKLQIKNTYIKIKMKLPFVYSCCIANTNDIFKNDYQSQNHKNLDIFSYFKIKDNNENNLNSENDEEEKDNEIKNKTQSEINKNKLDGTQNNNNNDLNGNKEKNNDLIEIEKISVEKIDDNENSKANDEKINVINIMSGEIKMKKKSRTVETNKTKKDNNDKSKNSINQNVINNILISNTDKNKNKNISNNSNIKKEILKNIINNKEAMECKNSNNSSDNTIKNIEEIKKITNINLIQENNDNNNKDKESIKEEENKDQNKKIIKIMKKIKFKKDEKNIKNKEEYFLPNINNINNKEIENILRNLDFKNSHSIQENSSKAINPISLQDTNLNNISNFIPNQNKSNNKIMFNKYNFFQIGSNSFMQNNRNSNNLIDQSESLINPISFIQKEKNESEKDESKEK